MDDELPANFNVRYIREATKYDAAAKLAKRLIGNSGTEATLDLPIEECAYELYRITRQVLEPGWEDFPSRAADAVARRLGW